MRDRLLQIQETAADMVRYCARDIDPDHIRPLSSRDDSTMRTSRAMGLAVWQEREAFFSFFAQVDPDFNGDLFREKCKAP